MKRTVWFLLLVAAGAMHARAEWTLIYPYPQNSPIEEMKFIDAQRGWFVTSAGTIWRTTNGGATWVNQRKHSQWGLAAIEFADPLNGWGRNVRTAAANDRRRGAVVIARLHAIASHPPSFYFPR